MMSALSLSGQFATALRPQPFKAEVDVPSAQPVELHEVLVDQVGADIWVRFRFLARDIGKDPGQKSFADVEQDFAVLCDAVARPYLKEYDLSADVIAISLMSKPVDFGVSDPDATQFFEVFRLSSDGCVWEGL